MNTVLVFFGTVSAQASTLMDIYENTTSDELHDILRTNMEFVLLTQPLILTVATMTTLFLGMYVGLSSIEDNEDDEETTPSLPSHPMVRRSMRKREFYHLQ